MTPFALVSSQPTRAWRVSVGAPSTTRPWEMNWSRRPLCVLRLRLPEACRSNRIIDGSWWMTWHGGQSGSRQSIRPSQSLSIMSLQISGTQSVVLVVEDVLVSVELVVVSVELVELLVLVDDVDVLDEVDV